VKGFRSEKSVEVLASGMSAGKDDMEALAWFKRWGLVI
jgi:hypothetical protein